MSELLPSNVDFWWTILTGLLGGTIAFLLSRTAEARGFAAAREKQTEIVAPDLGNSQVRQIETALRSLFRSSGHHFHSDDLQKILEPIVKENLQIRGKLESTEARLTEQSHQLKSYIAQAQTDGLTGLSNRRCFDDILERRVNERIRRRLRFSLLLIDIDHFKVFNDAYGHLAGDMVLKGVAAILTKLTRDSDCVARYGGEEFAIVLADSDLENAIGVAERIRTQVERHHFCVNEVVLHVTTSVGVTELQPNDSVTAAVERADAALYDAKSTGRNQTHYHDLTQTQRVPVLQFNESEKRTERSAPVIERDSATTI